VFCLAVTVRDNRNEPTLAMSVSVPVLRATLDRLAQSLSLLAAGSIEIAARAGGTAPDPLLTELASPQKAEQALLALAASKRYPLSFSLAREKAGRQPASRQT
jgi:hypothetical protein